MILNMEAILIRLYVTHGLKGESAEGGCAPSQAKCEALGIIEYWMPISDYRKPNNNFNIINKGRYISMKINEKKCRDDHCSKK